jgi:hypothetical protein
MIARNLPRLAVCSLILTLVIVTLPRPEAAASSNEKPLSPETVFSNPANIAINTAASAPALPVPFTPYPSPITVSGMTGNVTKLTISLYGFSTPRQTNFDVLLVGPTGANLIVASDIGSFNAAASDLFLTIDDSAAAAIPTFSVSPGTYRPTNAGGTDPFPAPAPAGPYNSPAPTGSATLASIFNGTDPNGDWKLFVVEDEFFLSSGSAGAFANGWSMQVTTSGSPATAFANSSAIAYNDFAVPANPYPSTINVSGMAGVVSNLTVTLSGFNHARPSEVQIMVTDPNGRPFILMSGIGGTTPVVNANITFDDAATTSINQPIVSGTFRPSQSGSPSFPAPAPPPPYFQAGLGLNSSLGGYSPNGVWSLFVIDSSTGAPAGSIAGGWSLNITTVPAVPPAIGCVNVSLTAPTTFAVGAGPTGMASQDFNGDTKPDLAIANQNSNNVSILLNDGSGGFGTPTNFTAGTNPYSIATGKFNADAFEDLAVVNGGSGNISILLGNGMGGFGSPTNFTAGPSPISVAVGDFNADGNQDLAVANFGGFFLGTVSILLGTGTGSFEAQAIFSARTQPSFVATADFNNDGKKDLAVANFGSNNVSILLGTGTGAFTYTSTVNTGSGPAALAITDTNSDGKPDLAIANYAGSSSTTATGNGDGTFTVQGTGGDFANPISIAYGDLNGDGRPDLAYANSGRNDVTLNGPSLFATVTMGGGPYAVVLRDFDGDGRLDLATANNNDNNVAVALNRCTVAVGNLFDFDRDQRTDLAVFRPSTVTWFILLSAGGGVSTDIFGGPLDRVVAADYTGDGQTDYATYRPASGVWVSRNRADQRQVLRVQFGLPTDTPVPADYDGDGRADIAVFRPNEGNWFIRLSKDNSTRAMTFGTAGDLPVPADYDGDHQADLAVFRPADGSWYILQSATNSVLSLHFGATGDRPVADDYDGDGKADIAVFREGNWYLLQSHDGSFLGVTFGTTGDIPVPGDYDRDGKFDFAVFRPSTGTWYRLLTSTGSFVGSAWGVGTDIAVPSTDVP